VVRGDGGWEVKGTSRVLAVREREESEREREEMEREGR